MNYDNDNNNKIFHTFYDFHIAYNSPVCSTTRLDEGKTKR